MRNLLALGILLTCVGVAALAYSQFSYTETKPVLKAGPIEVTTQEQHHISIPTIGGVIILLAGLGFVFAGIKLG